jgi:HlyD family secretion protein
MTAEVEIITDRLPNVVHVPLQAVFDRDGKKIVYVKQGDKYAPTEVTLGARSESQVVIEKGLKGEEQVALLEPEARAATGGTKKSSVSKAIGK